MKVIKKGRIKDKIKHKIKCDECGAVVECTRKELEFVSDDRDGDFYWFKCPECKAKQAIGVEVFA